MPLSIVKNEIAFKQQLHAFIGEIIDQDSVLKIFIAALTSVGEIYIVGGFIRDFANERVSRDVDIITVIRADDIQLVADAMRIPCKRNRHGGFKLQFSNIEVDIWSILDNWAFKMQLVTSDPEDVRSIARGTFFNFDSLVFAIISKKISVDNYNNCLKYNTLDILQKNGRYRAYNPTREANILRAFYLHAKHQFHFSPNLAGYIKEHLLYYQNKKIDYIFLLQEYLSRYPKYEEKINSNVIEEYCNRVLYGDGFVFIKEDDRPKLF